MSRQDRRAAILLRQRRTGNHAGQGQLIIAADQTAAGTQGDRARQAAGAAVVGDFAAVQNYSFCTNGLAVDFEHCATGNNGAAGAGTAQRCRVARDNRPLVQIGHTRIGVGSIERERASASLVQRPAAADNAADVDHVAIAVDRARTSKIDSLGAGDRAGGAQGAVVKRQPARSEVAVAAHAHGAAATDCGATHISVCTRQG